MTEARALPIPYSNRNCIQRLSCALPTEKHPNYFKISPSNSLKQSHSNTTTSNSSPSSTCDRPNLPRKLATPNRYGHNNRQNLSRRTINQNVEPTDINRRNVCFESLPNRQLITISPSEPRCTSSSSDVSSPFLNANSQYREKKFEKYSRKNSAKKSNEHYFIQSPTKKSPGCGAYYIPKNDTRPFRAASQSNLCYCPAGQKRKLAPPETYNWENPRENRMYSSNLTLNICHPDSAEAKPAFVTTTKFFVGNATPIIYNDMFPLRKSASTANLRIDSTVGFFDAARKAELLSGKYKQNSPFDEMSRNSTAELYDGSENAESNSYMRENDLRRNSLRTSSQCYPMENNNKFCMEIPMKLQNPEHLEKLTNPGNADQIVAELIMRRSKLLEEEVVCELDKILEYDVEAKLFSNNCSETTLKNNEFLSAKSEKNGVVDIDSDDVKNKRINSATNPPKAELDSNSNYGEVQEMNIITELEKSLNFHCEISSRRRSEKTKESRRPPKLNLEVSSCAEFGVKEEHTSNIHENEAKDFLLRCIPYMQPSRRDNIIIKHDFSGYKSENSIEISDDSF